MRIATWNIERLKHHKLLERVLLACERTRADILVLTETDHRVNPDYPYRFHTPLLANIHPTLYSATENRVSIYTNLQCVRQHRTCDEHTALCVELETEKGHLLVYGTIIGIYGNRHPSFQRSLMEQLDDIKRLSASGTPMCICGDFNCSFSDGYYFTKQSKEALLRTFSEHGIELLTKNKAECIDHIAVSKRFVSDSGIQIVEWNQDKRLSDHKGISVIFS
ncbi:MAG: endonuclease/exonuclease/phosphatase family protein [Lawsonibacter sp.]|nr:endonuclease/exonuclease/phosphatase family protein [Lawsonibacter sp.]